MIQTPIYTAAKIVEPIELKCLTSEQYVQLMEKVQKFLNASPIVFKKISPLSIQFCMLMEKLKEAFNEEKSSNYYHDLENLDRVRQNLKLGICHIVEATRLHTNDSKSTAAEKLKQVIKRYQTPSLKYGGYDDQTALLRTLVSNLLDGPIYAYSQQTGIINWLSELDEANDSFEELMVARENEAGELGFTIHDVRKELSPIFRKIIQVVESFVLLGGNPQFSEFITKLNSEIKYRR